MPYMTLLKSIQPDASAFLQLEKQFIYKNFFFVKKNNRNVRVNVNDIYWVKADGSSVEITYTDGVVITYANLRSFKNQIQHPNLVRVQRSYIVNLLKISSYDDQFLYIKVKDEEFKIPFGRTYRKDALKHFSQLKAD